MLSIEPKHQAVILTSHTSINISSVHLSHCCSQAKFDESAISGLFRIMVRSVFKKQGRKASARIEPSLGLALGIHVRNAKYAAEDLEDG